MKKSKQLAIEIINLFEDVLEEHNIIIPDSDRPEGNDTPLYGTTYGNLVDEITDVLEDKELDAAREAVSDLIFDVVDKTEGLSEDDEVIFILDDIYGQLYHIKNLLKEE